MSNQLTDVKWGLALVLLGLLFGIALGVYFGVNEDAVQAYIANGIAAHPALHDAHSQDKIWRLVQRAHFHATGIGAFSLSLLLLVAMCDLMPMLKKAASTLIGLSAFYPLAWFTEFYLAPSIGRGAAGEFWLTQIFVYVSVGGLLLGMAILLGNLFLRLGTPPKPAPLR